LAEAPTFLLTFIPVDGPKAVDRPECQAPWLNSRYSAFAEGWTPAGLTASISNSPKKDATMRVSIM